LFELDKERPEYGFYYDDDKSAKPLDESSLSDYYVPTERELGGDKNSLEIWMIALIVIGGVVGLVLVFFFFREAIKMCRIGDSSCTFWFWWPHDDTSESVAVESSSGVNKDKFVASMLVDMRVHDRRVDSLVESTTESEGSVTRQKTLLQRRSNRWSSLMTIIKEALRIQATAIPMP
jgi:hypothetical protein